MNMNNLNGETYSEKLTLMLDGELNPAQEVPLFAELASNDELRTEMREAISIKNSVKNDYEAFVPPLAATSSVFAKAGFRLPLSYFHSYKHIILRYSWIPVLLALITGVTTWYILDKDYAYKYDNLLLTSNQLERRLENTQALASQLEKENLELKILNSQLPKEREVIKYIKIPVVRSSAVESRVTLADNNKNLNSKEFDSDRNENYDNQSVALSSMNSPNYSNGAFFLGNWSSNSNTFERNRLPVSYNSTPIAFMPSSYKYQLIFRGINSLAYPMVNVPSNSGGLSNIALGMYFRTPYDFLSIGPEFGNEPFSQRFIHSENGKRYIYEQLPSVWWAGAGFMASMSNKIDGLFGAVPFGKLFLGATELGPMGKLSAGLQWKSDSWGLGAFLGVEGSMMAYQNQSRWYSSEKLGITYGLTIQF